MKNKTFNLKKLSFIRPSYIIAISFILAALLIISAVIEYNENKNEIRHLLGEYANSTIDLITKSSTNILSSESEIENILSQHLLGVAKNIKRLDSLGMISDEKLVEIANENNVYRINIFDNSGKKIFSNNINEVPHSKSESKYSPKDFILPLLKGEKSEIVIGFKEARFEVGSRFAVAVKRTSVKGGAIVVNLDAEEYLKFRKNIGFDKMINDIGSKRGIEYIILQNENKIIASNKPVDGISRLSEDNFLKGAFDNNLTQTREVFLGDKKVFELVAPFILNGEKLGLYRVGLSMDEIVSAENRMYRRTLIISIVLIFISIVVIGIIVSNQNYRLISNEYKKIQTFTGNILDKMTQAIITSDLDGTLRIFNKAAEELFDLKSADVIGKKVKDSIPEFEKYFQKNDEFSNHEITFKTAEGENKFFNVNKTLNYSSEGKPEFITLVVNDITEIKKMELKNRQNEKMVAMGELASAFAHEVRNPLNSINMIAQRLNKEYKDIVISEEFVNLNSVLQSESKRINNIIEEFLKYARPPKLNLEKVNSKEFISKLSTIIESNISDKNIEFVLNERNNVDLYIDVSQMNQALINIVNNAIDSIDGKGKIELNFCRKNDKVVIEITDTGKGIPKENLNRIFNLYFTTKVKGTGLGLSIVQQIISQHNGAIYVESSEGKGTKFIIELPI
jgi:PAS domain S-box-containing protein